MTMLSEKIVVTAGEFLERQNINESPLLRDPLFQVKLQEYGWELSFAAGSVMCEVIWQEAFGREFLAEKRQLHRLFAPSPVATHSNFRGCKSGEFRTGNVPKPGSIAAWKRGNSWQGHMALVVRVPEPGIFDVIEARVSDDGTRQSLRLEEKNGKRTGLDFRNDKLNLLGFIYPPEREIR